MYLCPVIHTCNQRTLSSHLITTYIHTRLLKHPFLFKYVCYAVLKTHCRESHVQGRWRDARPALARTHEHKRESARFFGHESESQARIINYPRTNQGVGTPPMKKTHTHTHTHTQSTTHIKNYICQTLGLDGLLILLKLIVPVSC